ncbi:polyketide cyclase/dehydrase/lipid transport protein [Motilibacter peucedani]|uniref:Polyketide cyclase/dehydrase/lipid transport protein n=1 Tax=Motilibacter peucedani TaxID=598650 RepID=A0A420XM62_9ACTN|nr:SRPBCC family protein [Motilibacter peucedani]RKS72459.1 polyketide cyclase/dehydrase/lipid transport protein [Motilibacter peucedani]
MAQVSVSVDVAASAQQVWDTLVDWESQGDWMLLTKVRATAQDGQGVGGGIEGFTGVGPVGVLDTMVIRTWDPPRRCVVRHTGRVVRGAGAFEVEALDEHRSRFTWAEYLELPLGALGRLGWPLARPFMVLGMRQSLRRFARSVEPGA